jgi:hypothetical protein
MTWLILPVAVFICIAALGALLAGAFAGAFTAGFAGVLFLAAVAIVFSLP